MKLHQILEYDDYDYDYEQIDLDLPIGLCAGEDEYIDTTLRLEVNWDEDEDYFQHRIMVPELQDVLINEPFTFLGKQYKKGQPFPDELIMFLCGFDGAPMDVGDFGAIIHQLSEKAMKDLQKIFASGPIGDPSKDMRGAVWIHKYLKPQNKTAFNNAAELLKRIENRDRIFKDYVNKFMYQQTRR